MKTTNSYPDYYVEMLKGQIMIYKAYYKMSQECLKNA